MRYLAAAAIAYAITGTLVFVLGMFRSTMLGTAWRNWPKWLFAWGITKALATWLPLWPLHLAQGRARK
ncbi:hypothetical protein EOE18_13905 [Novosphingobium umbonatum]|uniref:Uncharacterized protein n=1 Tax=Novosphingobium umbonatum TaxID=1908524 RepID=A0A437N201_9SPHN|nr:hypothetical protein [Novosphingobium umbonatum]RVU03943.1 hypothetical protein EOE18_13905 [Novosphingobium umbonatum]